MTRQREQLRSRARRTTASAMTCGGRMDVTTVRVFRRRARLRRGVTFMGMAVGKKSTTPLLSSLKLGFFVLTSLLRRAELFPDFRLWVLTHAARSAASGTSLPDTQ